jgi:2-dehydropantoate 2-reductase
MNVELDRLLAGRPSVPVVMMTPMLPPDFDRLVRTHGARVRAGMPGVAGYVAADGTCRYWMPRVAPTLIDAATPVPEALGTLVDALRAAGFVARLAPDIGSANPATTISFIPLAMGMDAAGGISALLADRELLRTTLGAIAEAKVLASRVGSRPAWLEWLTRFAGPVSLRIGVSLARRRAPEVLAYVEDHFGRKLHAQNLVMAGTMAAMAHRMQAPADALGRLLVRLEAAPGPTGSPEAAMAAPPSPQK